ncbi:hypothetical protein [Sediminicola sp. 1XM1-17]|uniref:hypothetical protein n=1 Tax=Sediminicola sp. 1XM1-17 TaxID=3127702 RepID=UPI0030782B1F
MRKYILIGSIFILAFLALVYFSVSETKESFRTCEVLDIADVDQIKFGDFDSVTLAANTLYEASELKKIMQGEQYRDAWAEPITVPIAFLDTLKGGLKVIEQGGGKQTHSLELEDKQGIRYTLRSLSKDPEKLVPELAKDLGLENIVVDGVSAQHPYAALVTAKLSEAAEVLHTHPKLMFVPKQKLLGEHNDKYGNRLYFFEYESEGKVNWTGLNGIKELLDTEDLLELKIEKGDNVEIDQNALIRARLFDLLIGDWDRHAKQWGWAIRDNGGRYIAIPVPTDRDNAFFNLGGVIPSMVANKVLHPKVQTFEKDIDFLPGLVTEFDEYFLRSATLAQFKNEANIVRELMTDANIARSFESWPKAIDRLNGPEIREKLLARRDKLVETAVSFYGIIQERPKKDIDIKGMEELQLSGMMKKCFDCTEADYKNLDLEE